jgi:uncharacterized protein involved in exopolysaccharide biosynthesis
LASYWCINIYDGLSIVSDTHPPDIDDGMDLRIIVSRLAAHAWWLLASVIFFTAACTTAAFVLTPIYRASSVLIPAKSDKDTDSGSGLGGIGGVASLVGINLSGSDSLTEEALAVLKSREFTQKFIDDRNLIPVLYAKIWDSQSGKWKVDELHQPTPAKAYRYFNKKIRVITEEKKTSLITLNIDWTDRKLAADWANDLIQRLNLEMRKREMARADSAVSYLEKEFETTTAVATREAIGHLIEIQVKQRMLAAVTQEFAFRVIDHATAPDRDDRHFPNRLLMTAAGPFVGLLVGIICILGYAALKGPTDRHTSGR